MLDLSPEKLFALAVIALVVLGPNRLPAAARTIGRFVGQMRAMSASLQQEVREAIQEHDPEDEIKSALSDFRLGEARRTVRRAITDTLAPVQALDVRQTIQDAVEPRKPIETSSTDVARPVPDDPNLN